MIYTYMFSYIAKNRSQPGTNKHPSKKVLLIPSLRGQIATFLHQSFELLLPPQQTNKLFDDLVTVALVHSVDDGAVGRGPGPRELVLGDQLPVDEELGAFRMGASDERADRLDRERRAHDEKQVDGLKIHPLASEEHAREALPEEDDVRLDVAGALVALRHLLGGELGDLGF